MSDHSYERVTQLLPAAATLAPVTVLALLLVRFDDAMSAVRSILSIAVAAGFHLVAARLVRDRGNRVQKTLWAAWGGSPTLQLLRWGGEPQPHTERLHRRVSNMTGVTLPSSEQQQAAPAEADELYDYAIHRLREMTRDHDKYPRIWSELQQYGTARNMYGAKPAALFIAAVAFVASSVVLSLSVLEVWDIAWWLPALSVVFSLAAAVAWLTIINDRYVRTASFRYADALFAAPDEPSAAAR